MNDDKIRAKLGDFSFRRAKIHMRIKKQQFKRAKLDMQYELLMRKLGQPNEETK
jgi:hypothetical protein